MMSNQLTRWGAVANIAAGLLFAAFTLLHPTGTFASNRAALVLGSPWAEIHTLGIAALLLTMIGLVGLYLPRASELPPQSTYGFLCALLGTALCTSLFYADGYLLPYLAQYAPELFGAGGPLDIQFTLFGVVTFLAGIALMSGYLAFYSVLSRERMIPRWCCTTIMLGGLGVGITLGGYGVLARLRTLTFGMIAFELIAGLLFAVGLIWLGFLMLRSPAAPARARPA